MHRRSFLQTGLTGLGSLAIQPTLAARPLANSDDKLRVAVLGCGLRGQNHLDLLLRREDCEIVALAEIDPRMQARTEALFSDFRRSVAPWYTEGEDDYLRLLEEVTPDAVIIATPWRWHTPMALAAMEAGCYVGMEVCGAFSLDECWQLVRTRQRTGSQLFFLENVCYRRDVMAVLRMVREGLFGELIHLEGGYQHDLRHVKFNDGEQPYGGGVEFGEAGFSEASWRTQHSVHRNGDLYPTHGIGPLAQYLNINRGNRFETIRSVSSKARGLHEYIVNHPAGGPDHPNAAVEFRLGDKVTSLITTAKGETIALHHDTNLPRPYSLGFRVQGTKGLWMDVNDSIYVEGESEAHRWSEAAPWLERYDHPYWSERASLAEGAGHGGMDYFLMDDFVSYARADSRPPIDVYDAASWLAITPLSEASIARGGGVENFPDFTEGKWAFNGE